MEQSEIFKAEIKELEAKLEAKKREMAGTGREIQPERDIFRQVVREHAGGSAPEISQPAGPAPSAPQGTYVTISQPLSEDEEKKLQKIIQEAFSSGIKAAVNEAKRTNDPYFVDLLHDYLADQYYHKLIQAKRLKND